MIADLSRPLHRPRRASRWRQERRMAAAVLGALIVALMLLVLLGQAVYGGASGGTQTVRVQAGDTVWSIAAAHDAGGDVRARVDEILSVNHLDSGGHLIPGQTLVLPAQ